MSRPFTGDFDALPLFVSLTDRPAPLYPTSEDFQLAAMAAGRADPFTVEGAGTIWRLEAIRARRGDTAAERLLSRAGISDIHAAVSGGAAAIGPENAAEVIARARSGEPAALHAMSIFSGLLGAFAGDMALTFAARGGVYLNSSLIQDMGELLDLEAFQRRFRGKGLMSDYMLGIPVMQMPGRPVLLGLSSLFSASDRVYGATDVKFLDC